MFKGEEDYLFLIVFTPQLPGSSPLKPVTVWIHGVAFIMGSGNTHLASPRFLLDAGDVVVAYNYRLGIFGCTMPTTLLRLCLLLLVLLQLGAQDEVPTVSVRVHQGALRGKKEVPKSGGVFYSFQGIPYAKPPLGELRFKAPAPPEPWIGTRDALEDGHVCKQFDPVGKIYKGDEDCLFINVFTPQLPGSSPLKPVMLWIHGGAFIMGSGNTRLASPRFLLDAGVVVVTFNYRLGIFGFLSTEDAAAPGNAGMKDQVAALRWVQQNIAVFGGDPNKVTIFGESAGAVSVHYLMLSPMSAGLLQGAIAQSGSALNPRGLYVQPREHAFLLGETLGFSGNTSSELVDFLRTMDAQQLVVTSVTTFPEREKYRLLKNSFAPSLEPPVEGETSFLPDTPLRLVDQGKFHKVPFITGTTTAEGIIFIKFGGLIDDPGKVQEIEDTFVKVFQRELCFCQEEACGVDMIHKIKSFYFGDKPLANDTLENLVQMCTDMVFTEGNVHAVEKMSQSNEKVYLYEFSYDGGLGIFKQNLNGVKNFSGVVHADDLGYLFDYGVPVATDSLDARIRSSVITMWTNFAKTGNPTPEATAEIPTGTPYKAPTNSYLDIGRKVTVKRDLNKERMDFWRELYSSV